MVNGFDFVDVDNSSVCISREVKGHIIDVIVTGNEYYEQEYDLRLNYLALRMANG